MAISEPEDGTPRPRLAIDPERCCPGPPSPLLASVPQLLAKRLLPGVPALRPEPAALPPYAP